MSSDIKKNEPKKPSLLIALIPIISLVVILYFFVVVFEQDVHIPLIIGSIIAAGVARVALGTKWDELEKGILATINMGMQAVIILMIIGILIGTLIAAGVVPTLIYYGLKMISPGIFLAVSMIICSIVSISTGSSWSTAGTIGVALIGIAYGLGIPAGMAAGAVISGAYFGDKMSPLSDTTNLAPAMAGATLFDHIRHMIYTTGISYVIVIIIFVVLGLRFSGSQLDTQNIQGILDTLSANFKITPLLLIPPLLDIVKVAFRVPENRGLLGGVILGVLFALILQGVSFEDVMYIGQEGFSIEFENATSAQEMVAELLSSGGLQSMMWTVSLIICALTFGGILEATGMLAVLAESMLKLAKGTGSLVLVTVLSCFFVNLVSADQYLAIVIPGRMFKDAYAERHLAPKNLSRTLEDAGTLTSPLIPWNTCGAFMSQALKVPTLPYAPWALLNIINPIVAVVLAYLGIFQTPMTPEEVAAYEASKHHAVA